MGDQSTRSEYRWNNRAKGCGFASVQKCLHPCVVILELTVCVCVYDQLRGCLIRTCLDLIYVAFL